MNFELVTAGRIVFGPGARRELAAAARAWGRRAFIVTGRSAGRAAEIWASLAATGVDRVFWTIPAEPTTDIVAGGVAAAREERCDLVIGAGGGSALDAAKAIAIAVTNPGPLLDYLEVIGAGKPIAQPPLPCLVLPTTAGTGAEVTRNAVLTSPEHQVKVSLRSPLLLPKVAIVDPDLTRSLPPAMTAATGMDALTQLVEPYVSLKANPLTDGWCEEGLRRVARSLRRAFQNGEDADARQDMSLASLLGGLALANAGLGAVHGFAGPVGGRFPAPHGAICAALLPRVMEMNLQALRQRAPRHPAFPRYEAIARLLTGHPQASADEGVAWIRELGRDLAIPGLSRWGIRPADIPALVEQAARASSMKANPVVLTADELSDVLARAG